MTSDRNASPLPRLLAGDLVIALLMGLAGASWLAWLQLVGQGRPIARTALLTSVVAVTAFTLQGVLVAVPLTLRAVRNGRDEVARPTPSARTPRSRPLMAGLVCAPVAAAVMSAGNQVRLVLFDQAPAGPPIVTLVGDALTLLVVLLPVSLVLLGLRHLRSRQIRSADRARACASARAGLALGLGSPSP